MNTQNEEAQRLSVYRCELNGSQRRECCVAGLFQSDEGSKEEVQKIVPIKAVNIVTLIEGIVATIEVELKYENIENQPIDCTYEFPLNKKTLFTDFKATILDKVIKTIVKEKEKAKKQYEVAVKRGKVAIMAERATDET